MNKININEIADICSEFWTEINQENLDSLIVAAEMFNYKVKDLHDEAIYTRVIGRTFLFVLNEKVIFNLSFVHDNNVLNEIIVVEFYSGYLGGYTKHHFNKNYDKAINYAKTLL